MKRVLIGLGTPVGHFLSAGRGYASFYSYKQAIRGISTSDEAVVVAPTSKRLSRSDLRLQGEALANALIRSAGRVILVSSIDVYLSRGLPFDEAYTGVATEPARSPLALFEQTIAALGKRAISLRLADPFGPYMRGHGTVLLDKDATRINRVAIRQWYPIWRLESDIARARDLDVASVNLCTEPLPMRSVLDRLFPGQLGFVRTPAPYSRVRTRYAEYFGGASGYIMRAEDVLDTIVRYVTAARLATAPSLLAFVRTGAERVRGVPVA